jgi:hypothetical protein
VAPIRHRAFAALVATVVALFAAGVGSGQDATPGPDTPPTNANAILARVKAALRAQERPAYVSYTLVRHERLDNVPDLFNSYTLRIWCRTADNAALSRRAFGSRATGAAAFIVPAFDKPIDPGPPTADLLDVIRATQGSATPPPGSPPVIGSVSVVIETNYHVMFAGIDGGDDHLRLEARRDPERNRLTDLYVDRTTFALHRAVAHDHLYTDERTIAERFEIDFGTHEGIPVITTIHGQTDYAALDATDANEPLHEVDYRFEDVTFPTALPDWYFQPETYGAHRAEYPV